MARGLNRVFLIGALATRPDMRYTPAGLAILDLTLAGQDLLLSDNGGEREVSWYHRVRLLGRQAEMWGDLQVRAAFLDPLDDRGKERAEDSRGQPRLRAALNQVFLMGNLTRDPELRYTPQGTAVARLGLAVNERRQGAEERTHFVEVQAWRDLAEWAAELRKGDGLFVIGRLVNDSWTSSSGERRFQTRVEALRLERPTRGPAQAGGSRSREVQTGGVDIDEGLEDFPPEEDLPF